MTPKRWLCHNLLTQFSNLDDFIAFVELKIIILIFCPYIERISKNTEHNYLLGVCVCGGGGGDANYSLEIFIKNSRSILDYQRFFQKAGDICSPLDVVIV